MANPGVAVHRTIVAVDVEGFGDRCRTNRNQVAVRDGLYRAMREAFGQAGIPWADRDHEDRGDGVFILVGPEVPKSVFAESLPSALVSALCLHNGAHPGPERIRLRMALHAGEVHLDEHGATGASVNLAFRLLESGPVKAALAASRGCWRSLPRHGSSRRSCGTARPVPGRVSCRRVAVKETTTTGWICLPDPMCPSGQAKLERLPAVTAVPGGQPGGAAHAAAGDGRVRPGVPASWTGWWPLSPRPRRPVGDRHPRRWMGWPGSARPRSPCTPPTSSPPVSPTGRFSFACMRTVRGSGRSIRLRCSPPCC